MGPERKGVVIAKKCKVAGKEGSGKTIAGLAKHAAGGGSSGSSKDDTYYVLNLPRHHSH